MKADSALNALNLQHKKGLKMKKYATWSNRENKPSTIGWCEVAEVVGKMGNKGYQAGKYRLLLQNGFTILYADEEDIEFVDEKDITIIDNTGECIK